MSDELLFPDEFVPNIQGAPYHSKWVSANKTESTRWATFRDALLAGNSAVPPSMSTKYGRALVAAGKLHMSVTDIGAVWDTPPSQPPSWTQGTLVINTGGTYTISQESVTTAAAVVINTTQQVNLTGWVRNSGGGPCIFCTANLLVNLNVSQLYAYGTYPGDQRMAGRFIDAERFGSIVVEHCTIDGTAGTGVVYGSTGGLLRVRYNYHHNVKDNPPYDVPGFGGSGVGNFVQMSIVQGTTCEIAWNQVINEYDLSFPEDIISVYYTQNASVHDNYLQHQSKPGNVTNTSSQGGITLEGDSRLNNNIIRDNQVVDGYGISCYPNPGGHDNQILNNRIIADRLLPNGQTKGNGYGTALNLATGGTNNRAIGNVVGYIDYLGQHIDFDASSLAGSAVGGTAEAANNTHFVGTLDAAAEAAELTTWQAKLLANGVTVGVG